MVKFFRTIPFWHNFTGISNKGDFSLPGVTCLDEISKEHDKAGAKFPAWKSKDKQKNIKADQQFIDSFLDSIRYGSIIFHNIELTGWKAIYNIPIDFIIGLIGVCIFKINIFIAKKF